MYDYSADRTAGIKLPIVIRTGEQSKRVLAKVDTGASFCIFAREHGEALGLTIDAVPRTELRLANNAPLFVRGHRLVVEVFEYSLETTVYFAEEPDFPRDVVGRSGFLDRLRVAIVDYDSVIHVSHYDDP